ncbi:MAG: hypothetical protein KF774_13215 [Planctomyces sp.]|nr:hypothetical protein [Planctomyces sp.]
MKRLMIPLGALALVTASLLRADWSVSDVGAWSKDWPAELDSLRGQSRTIIGGLVELEKHLLVFQSREEFERAWPHLLKVKSPGAPIILRKSPMTHWHFGEIPAGVLVHAPPRDSRQAEKPIDRATSVHDRWMWTRYLEVAVDGEIVDLNRIRLPPDTPIIDLRFDEPETPPVSPDADQKTETATPK